MPSEGLRRTRQDAVRNRDRVLDAATDLVLTDGEKVPMAAIADRAGVGIGTVYRHFPTRDDLLAALVERSFGIAAENARAAAAYEGSALDAVEQFFLSTLRDRDRFVLPLHGGPMVFGPEARRLQADVRVSLGALLARGWETGELRDDLTPEDLIVAASMLSRALPGPLDWERVARRQIAMMVGGLGARKPRATRRTRPTRSRRG